MNCETRTRKNAKALEIVIGLIVSKLYFLLELLEALEVRAICSRQHFNYLFKLLFLKTCSQGLEVDCTISPVLNFIKWRGAFLRRLGVLARHNLLNLACPVDNSRLKTLDEVFVFGCDIDVDNVFLGNVELRFALHLRAFFSQIGHELVKVGLELFFDPFWPFLLAVESGHVLSRHLVEQVVERVVVDLAANYLITDSVDHDGFLATALDEVADLVVLWLKVFHF